MAPVVLGTWWLCWQMCLKMRMETNTHLKHLETTFIGVDSGGRSFRKMGLLASPGLKFWSMKLGFAVLSNLFHVGASVTSYHGTLFILHGSPRSCFLEVCSALLIAVGWVGLKVRPSIITDIFRLQG